MFEMDTKQKLSALRSAMKESGVQGYLVPRADEFQGEFVAPYAERLQWLSGFTGSAGIAIILVDKAVVMSDGRYTLQLDAQVDLNCFETANSVKAKPEEWLFENGGGEIGYDPMLFTPAQVEAFEKKNNALKPISENLIDQIWQDQPGAPKGKVSLFSQKLAGISAAKKIEIVKAAISEHAAQACLIALPDSVSWLLNIRGSDTDFIPSVHARALVHADGAVELFIDKNKLGGLDIPAIAKPPEALLETLNAIDGKVLMDFKHTPIALKTDNALNAPDPCIAPKAIKTESEITAIKAAHIIDGVAVTKFLYWLAHLEGEVTEQDAESKILALRKSHPAFKGMSFPTIAGFGPNGAIIHYRASAKTNAPLKQGSLLLVDSGGQYYDGKTIAGTTDITRTVAIGKPSKAMREHYTLVLKGHIGLANATFPKTATGAQVDVFARKPLWEAGIDYAHGTGHGVGCYLAVHEEAASLSVRGTSPVKPGMLISNEPGFYEEGAYGIRTENLVLCVEKGEMLGFETIGYAPFDKTLIVMDMLNEGERAWLKAYNEEIKSHILPKLDAPEAKWLLSQIDL